MSRLRWRAAGSRIFGAQAVSTTHMMNINMNISRRRHKKCSSRNTGSRESGRSSRRKGNSRDSSDSRDSRDSRHRIRHRQRHIRGRPASAGCPRRRFLSATRAPAARLSSPEVFVYLHELRSISMSMSPISSPEGGFSFHAAPTTLCLCCVFSLLLLVVLLGCSCCL